MAARQPAIARARPGTAAAFFEVLPPQDIGRRTGVRPTAWRSRGDVLADPRTRIAPAGVNPRSARRVRGEAHVCIRTVCKSSSFIDVYRLAGGDRPGGR